MDPAQRHTLDKHNKHTLAVRDGPVLPGSRLSHRGAGNLSCPITGDAAVKLSNKSVSGGGSAPPCWLCDRPNNCLSTSSSSATDTMRARVPPRSQPGGPGEGGQHRFMVVGSTVPCRWERKKPIYRNNATFSGLNIRGVINTKWILALFKPGGDETSEPVNVTLP